ncbi:hypothetical protein V6N11_006862 [Hibiscus sabdariffa]|uniref:Uncharacterized protein n=1 Tax=Hibiscus sabdariffa TaxID=183260 RepID=A0ABR2RRZ5_9ROSI
MTISKEGNASFMAYKMLEKSTDKFHQASQQPSGREPDDEFDGRIDGCLASEVAANRKRNERQLLPVIGAVSARETTSDARCGVDDWSRLDSSGFKDEFWQRQRQPEACLVQAKRFGLIPTGEDWYSGG